MKQNIVNTHDSLHSYSKTDKFYILYFTYNAKVIFTRAKYWQL